MTRYYIKYYDTTLYILQKQLDFLIKFRFDWFTKNESMNKKKMCKNQIYFKKCQRCSAFLPNNIYEKHLEICPNIEQPYILQRILYTQKYTLKKKCKIFLNSATIELLNLYPGDLCTLEYIQGNKCIWKLIKNVCLDLDVKNFEFDNTFKKNFSTSDAYFRIKKFYQDATLLACQIKLHKYKSLNTIYFQLSRHQMVLNDLLSDQTNLPIYRDSLFMFDLHGLFKVDDVKGIFSLEESLLNLKLNAVSSKDLLSNETVTNGGVISKNDKSHKEQDEYFVINDDTNFIFHVPTDSYYLFEKLKYFNRFPLSLHLPTPLPIIPPPQLDSTDVAKLLFKTLCFETIQIPYKEIRELMNFTLYSDSRNFRTKCLLVHGPSGVGKTTLIKTIAETFAFDQDNCLAKSVAAPTLVCQYIDMEKLETPTDVINSEDIDVRKKKFHQFLSDAQDTLTIAPHKPLLILIDQIHLISTSSENDADSAGHKSEFYSLLVSFIDDALTKHSNSLLIGITNHVEALDIELRKPGRFEYEIEINAPNNIDRFKILKHLIQNDECFGDIREKCEDLGINEIANKTHGFTGADLKSLLTRAYLEYHRSCSNQKKEINAFIPSISEALKYVKPSAMKEINLDIPQVKWSDIGGMEAVKKELIKTIEWPLKYPETYARMGLIPDRGILLHGPPGCSKTMIAKALATQSGLNFFSVKGPELFSKYVGESERMIRKIFAKAKTVAPSIVFFDEIDSIAVERSNDKNSSVGDRVLTQLLTELDGVEQAGHIYIVAATNRIDKIDKALLRPGRLGKIIHVSLPDRESRKAILLLKFQKMPVDLIESHHLDHLIDMTENFSGAEVVSFCQEAALIALEEDMNVEKVEMKHFEMARLKFDLNCPKI